MQRDVTKVSWDGERVLVRFECIQLKGVDEFEFKCCDEPAPELLSALNALRPHVADICDLPDGYCADLEIRGASFSYGGEGRVMGATITALKKLATANAPLVLNTPHLASAPYNEDTDDGLLLPGEAVDALRALQEQSLKYVDGQRMQTDLFAKPAAAQAS